MKLIQPSFNIEEQTDWTLNGIYKQIEKAGRTAYKSEHLITNDSAEKFVKMIEENKHGAVLEHGTVYLTIPFNCDLIDECGIEYYFNTDSPHIAIETKDQTYYITINYRILYESLSSDALKEVLKYLSEPTCYHHKRISVRFICDRGTSHELVRHRMFSFCMESQRYCNYSKNKFNNEVTFIIPCWADSLALQEAQKYSITIKDSYGYLFKEYYYHPQTTEVSWFPIKDRTPEENFITALQVSETLYLELLNQGWTAQQARSVLPNACKTELVMTGFVYQWQHFFQLRCDKTAHPSAQQLAIPLKEEFIKREYI